MENLILGFSVATTAANLLLCLLGAVLGTLVGVLPSLGPMATISILLPLTYSVGDPTGALIFLAGIYYGSQYGGSISAILLKLPGEASSAVTAIDGNAMTRNGRGGAALTITALASFVGGTVSTVVIAMLARPLSEVAFLFGPAEYASLMVLGILACVIVTQGDLFKGMIMVALGAFLGLVGTNLATGMPRFTGGIMELRDGIGFGVLAVGVFGLGELFYNVLKEPLNNRVAKVSSLYPTREEFKQSINPTLRGTFLGTFLGLLPGGVQSLSSFLSYAFEKRISPTPQDFGRGSVAGVASPEAANNASAQSNFLPTLMLGLPVTPVMGMMTAVMIVNGIQPGPNVINSNAGLFWGLIVSMWIGNLILVILNIPLVKIWVGILRIPLWIMYPLILVFCVAGVYYINQSWFDIMLMVLFGVFGLLARLAKFEVTPMALAFVVAPRFEEYFDRAMSISRGSWMTFIERPISLTLLMIALVLLCINLIWKRSARG